MFLSALAGIAVLVGSALDVAAQSTAPTPAPASVAPPTQSNPTSPVLLSEGAADVLKLATGHVGDKTIVAFVEASAETYRLSASEIVYLKEQGVSDQVLAVMLKQSRKTATGASQPPPQPAAALAVTPATRTTGVTKSAPQVPTVASAPPPSYPSTAQPSPAYVPTVPVYAPSQTVYVEPPALASYPYYGYYPYYGGYYGYSYPGLSFSFGLGGCYPGGGYYGGCYRGGIYYGGSYHGGGYHGAGYHGGNYYGGGYRGGVHYGAGYPSGLHTGGGSYRNASYGGGYRSGGFSGGYHGGGSAGRHR
jgi:hypothetical protein